MVSDMGKHMHLIMNVIFLMWGNSDYESKSPRIIVQLQEICNHIIEMVSEIKKIKTKTIVWITRLDTKVTGSWFICALNYNSVILVILSSRYEIIVAKPV